MNITETEKAMLRRIVANDDCMDLLKSISNNLANQWSQDGLVKETTFETVKAAIRYEERKSALNLFLQTISELAHGN